jgi:translocation and assembly module TamB
MRLKLLLIIACALILTALVTPAVLLWSALYTTAGLQFVVRHMPQQLGPVRLVITGISGTAAHGLSVERVQIDHELVHLEFTGITGRVALAPLLLQTIHVRAGSVHGALIEVKRRTHPSTPGPPQFLPRWMLISVDQGHVDAATLTVYNGFRMDVADIEGAALVRHSYIRLFQADAHWADAHLSAIGFLRAADPIGFDLKGHVEWTPPGQPGWTLAGSARGDLKALSIVAHTVSPFRAEVTGQLLTLTDHWHWVGDALVQAFDLAAWGMNGPLGQISGHLAGSGDENGFNAHGPVDPAGLHAGTFEAQFAGHYAAHVLTATHLEVQHVSSGAHVVGSGTIAMVDNGPRLELSGSWKDFRWPLIGRDPAIRSAEGSFTLSGLMPYRVRVQGRGRAVDLPEMPLQVAGTLDKDRFTFDPAEVDLFGGHASVSGQVSWSPHETWSVSGHLANVNPAALRPDLPGSVSFDLEASGRGFDPRGDLSTSFRNISGKLRGLSASGGGTVTHAGSAWGFANVRVALGGTSLALDGRLDQAMDLRFALATRDLGLLAPGSRGELKASGTVRGTLAEPAIAGSAHGGDVDAFGIKLGSFDADVDLDPGAPQKDSRANVQLRKLTYQGSSRTLDSVAFTLKGPPAAYEAQLSASATGLAVSLKASGPYARGLFKGQLQALTINGNQQLHLALERPVDLTLSLEHARVEWLCVVGTPGSMCADGDWTPAAWSSTLMANQLPLNTLTAGMTPAVEYVGTASVLARLSGGGSTPVQGTLRAELANAQIDHRLASHKVEHTRIGSGTVNVTATATQLSAEAQLGDGEVGTLHAQLQVMRTTPAWPDMPLSGELHAQFNESGLVSLYVPDIDRAAGHFSADVAVAGTVGAPRLSGTVKLSEGEMDVYQVNLGLRQVQMEARLGDGGVDFSGSAHAGAGTVSASGHLEWRKLLPYGKFHLQGTNLRVADVPEAQIDASPDLDFSVSGRRIEVTGKVAVPYAKIQPMDITAAVRASPDEVLVGSEVEDPNKRFEVMSDITLALGDKVSVDAAGLTGRLVGSVSVRSGYDAITRGTGELSVVEGKYTAYARKLDIERGRLIFTGGPIDDPGIDVRAVKVFPDVKAGVNVRGTLLQPRLTFFSDPPLPQAQVASLILAGGSLESAQNQGRASGAGSAALGQGAALLAAQLGTHVGLPDVSLETDPIANETSLVLGHYLSPRLYVSYGVSLTEQLNTFKARYTLGDHWTVRIELGTARGADLVYSIDK